MEFKHPVREEEMFFIPGLWPHSVWGNLFHPSHLSDLRTSSSFWNRKPEATPTSPCDWSRTMNTFGRDRSCDNHLWNSWTNGFSDKHRFQKNFLYLPVQMGRSFQRRLDRHKHTVRHVYLWPAHIYCCSISAPTRPSSNPPEYTGGLTVTEESLLTFAVN